MRERTREKRIKAPDISASIQLTPNPSLLNPATTDRPSAIPQIPPGGDVMPRRSAAEETRSGGQPLTADTRALMEPRFGHNFANVRIYTDEAAAEAAAAINARAFTIGQDIVFGAGRYQPDTDDGQRLLAHELTHVVQQQHTSPHTQGSPILSTPGDPHEVAAARVAGTFIPGNGFRGAVPVISAVAATHAVIQRDGPAAPTVPPAAKSGAPSGGATTATQTEDQYAKWKRHIDTPYGRIWYWEGQESRVLSRVQKAVQDNAEAKALYLKLQENLRKLGIVQTRVEEFSRPPIDISADISANATKEAVNRAETAEGSKNSASALLLLLKDFKKRLVDAQVELRLSNRALETAKKRERAAELRARGEEQDKKLEASLLIINTAFEVTADVISGGPAAAIKTTTDAIVELIQLFRENDFAAEAESLEKEAHAMEMEDLAERYNRAGDGLKHVADMLDEAQTMSKDVESDYVRQRGRAESEFDRTTRGSFRFGDVAQGIDLADQAYDIAHQTLLAGYKAEDAALAFLIEFFNDPWNQLGSTESNATGRAMQIDAKSWREEALTERNRADAARKQLRGLRMTAGEALVTAPGAGKPRR